MKLTRSNQSEPLNGNDGTVWDTEGLLLWPNLWLLHRDPEIFPQPDEFIPTRWLRDRRPESFPELSSNVFRSFEKGQRSCIGRELALVEMRVMAVLLLRRFDFRVDYEELDRRLGRKTPQCMGLERCYTNLMGSGAPCDGLPVFVKERHESGR